MAESKVNCSLEYLAMTSLPLPLLGLLHQFRRQSGVVLHLLLQLGPALPLALAWDAAILQELLELVVVEGIDQQLSFARQRPLSGQREAGRIDVFVDGHEFLLFDEDIKRRSRRRPMPFVHTTERTPRHDHATGSI